MLTRHVFQWECSTALKLFHQLSCQSGYFIKNRRFSSAANETHKNRGCVMSQSGYFEVKAVSDCVVCKTRGFNELALITMCHPRRHPQFHNVLDYIIITISHQITRTSNMKKDRTAPQSNIHAKKRVCVI